MKKTNFTLIELLVVIAIITILCSLLLPALGKAKETGKRITCTGNLKQTGIAYESYMADNGGYMHPVFNKIPTARYWHHDLLQADETSQLLNPSGYLSAKTLYCPSLSWTEVVGSYKWWAFHISYGINEYLAAYSANFNIFSEYESGRADKIMNPSIKIHMTDSNGLLSSGLQDKEHGFWRWTNNTGTSHGRPDARHSLSCNTLFLDGHVALIRPANPVDPISAAPFRWGDLIGSQQYIDVIDKRW